MITIWRRYECTQIDDTEPRSVWVPIPRIACNNQAGLDPRRGREAVQQAVRASMATVDSVDPYPGRDGLRYRKPLAFHWGVGLVDLIGVVDVTSDPVMQASAINFYEIGPLWGAWPWSSAPAACPEATGAADSLHQEIRAAAARAADEAAERIRASVRAGHFG